MAQFRKEELTNGHYYHIYSRSIAKFIIFNDQEEYDRFYQLMSVYRFFDFTHKYSRYLELTTEMQKRILNECIDKNNCLVEIVAYCIMPTHVHIILMQKADKGIAKYMSRVLNGYSRYFNTKHKRTGPLWAGRFKSVLVTHDEQLLHLSRYLHLNPTSAGLVDDIDDWAYSSYKEYIGKNNGENLCKFKDIINMSQSQYEKFVRDHKDYQRDLSIIKYLIIEKYSG